MKWACRSSLRFDLLKVVRLSARKVSTAAMASSATFVSLKPKDRIVYVTDIEGDFEYWQRYLAQSAFLKRAPPSSTITASPPFSPTYELELDDHVHLVYGGDVCDRGYGDLRVLQDLVSLKERYPHRVHFVLGNRDINKLRLLFSLQPALLKHVHANTYWTSRTEQGRKQAMEEVHAGDVVSKLKWILGKTMGAPIAFKCRQQELQFISAHSQTSTEIDDIAVAKSYLQSVHPEIGLLTKYLSYGQISLILGDNLFVHGALHDYNLGWLPPYRNSKGEIVPERRVDCVRVWTEGINAFAAVEMERYRKKADNYLQSFSEESPSSAERRPHSGGWLWEETGGYNHSQPGSGLVQYGMGALADRMNPSVIYSTFLKNGVAIDLSPQVAHWLAKAGIRRLLVGHQPNGDAPWIMKGEALDANGAKVNIDVISADNAYAKSVHWPKSHFLLHPKYRHVPHSKDLDAQIPHDCLSVSEFEKLHHLHHTANPPHNITTRGNVAMQQVAIEVQDDHSSSLSVQGTLTDGSTYRYHLPAKPNEAHDLIGRKTKDGWFVKATDVHIPDSVSKNYVLLAQSSEGFLFKNKLMHIDEVRKKVISEDFFSTMPNPVNVVNK